MDGQLGGVCLDGKKGLRKASGLPLLIEGMFRLSTRCLDILSRPVMGAVGLSTRAM